MKSPVSNTDNKLDYLLKDVVEITGANKGIVQVLNDSNETLKVISSYNVGKEFLSTFQTVKAFDPTACGRCLGLKTPIAIEDFLLDPAFYQFMQIIELEDIRSARSVPLYKDDQKTIIGIFSIYFPKQLHLIPNTGEIPPTQITEIAGLVNNLSIRLSNV